MKRWDVARNNFYFTSSLYLEEAPWYIFLIDYLIQNICNYFPHIPLPNIKIIRDGEKTTLKEYYGTTADLFHVYICEKVSEFCYSKTKTNLIEFPYFELKERFPESFLNDKFEDEYDEDDKKEIEENLKYSKKIQDEFNISYEKLKGISHKRFKDIYQ